MTRHFITVEWCKNGHRGIFCDGEGGVFSQDKPFTEEKMFEILGVFSLILEPRSKAFTEEEAAQHTRWVPLAEYTHQYGIALIPKEPPDA